MSQDVWIGGPTGALNDPANWSQGSVPGPTATALFPGGTDLLESSNSGSGGFSPSVVSVASGADLIFDDSNPQTGFVIGTLDISGNSTVYFNNSELIAQQVNVGSGTVPLTGSSSSVTGANALLNIDGAGVGGVLGQIFAAGPEIPQQGYTWSEQHGYGTVDLSAIIGDLVVHSGGSVIFSNNTVAANVIYLTTVGASGLLPTTGQIIPPGGFMQFFPNAPSLNSVANSDYLVWIATNPTTQAQAVAAGADLYNPISYFDETTGQVATVAPGAGNTVIFQSGTHDVAQNPSNSNPAIGSVILNSGADVFLHPAEYVVPMDATANFGQLILQHGSTLITGGVISNTVVLENGSTLTLNSDYGAHGPAGINIYSLENNGGTINVPNPETAILGDLPPVPSPLILSAPELSAPEPPQFVQVSGLDAATFVNGALSTRSVPTSSGIYSGESVLPSTNTLEIDLGTVTQGASIAPLNIAAYDAFSNDTNFNLQVASPTGSGFTPDLLSSTTIKSGIVALGSIAVNTQTLGTHTMLITMADAYTPTGGSQTAGALQTLELTDNVVNSAGSPSVPGTGTGTVSSTGTGSVSSSGAGTVSSTGTGTVSSTGTGTGTTTTTGVPCFLAGTVVETDRGPRCVEDLRPGDRVRCKSGWQTVQWVGHKGVRLSALLSVIERTRAAPILIRPGAFSDGVPSESVWLSPDHAVLVNDVLIPIHKLVNDRTILRDLTIKVAHYVHIELETHSVIMVAGLPCESFLDTGNRGQFDAECGVRPMYDVQRGDVDGLTATLRAYEDRGCAPLCLSGPVLRVVQHQLATRSGHLLVA